MKSLSDQLLDRSVSAMAAAIEVYNKPAFPYRHESFAILAINAWALLLKAKWINLNSNKKRSLFVYERRTTKTGGRTRRQFIKRTRSGSPFTHDISYLSKQLVNRTILDTLASQNLEIMIEFRNCATHFFNEDPAFNSRVHQVGAACVMNFANAVQEWFGRGISEFSIHLMPIAFLPPARMNASLLNAQQSSFLSYLDAFDIASPDYDSPYSVAIDVELRFVRSKAQDALPVQVTDHSSALQVHLSEGDIRERYPWDYKSLTNKCRNRYEDFKEGRDYHRIRKGCETDKRYALPRFLDPDNEQSSKKMFYNGNILAEFDKHFTKGVSAG